MLTRTAWWGASTAVSPATPPPSSVSLEQLLLPSSSPSSSSSPPSLPNTSSLAKEVVLRIGAGDSWFGVRKPPAANEGCVGGLGACVGAA